jgi:hypothetical protein
MPLIFGIVVANERTKKAHRDANDRASKRSKPHPTGEAADEAGAGEVAAPVGWRQAPISGDADQQSAAAVLDPQPPRAAEWQ